MKVLLNAYVTSMRIAEDRHVTNRAEAADPFVKYRSIAKLVCLQTEFPRFADAVADDPLLLPALTTLAIADEAGGDDAEMGNNEALAQFSERTRNAALEFFSGQRSIEEGIHRGPLDGHDGAQSPDTSKAEEASRSSRVRELVRYLYYTREIEDPTRDVIFGTSLGARYGLDPKIADQLEREALDGQDRQASELVASLEEDEEKVRALRVLCDQVHAPGMQSRHAFSALLRTADAIGGVDLSDLGPQLVGALSSATRTAGLPEHQIVPVLRLTRWFPEDDQREHQRALLERDEWRESTEEIVSVLTTADHWAAAVQTAFSDLIVTLMQGNSNTVLQTLNERRPETIAALWSERLWEEAVSEPDLPALVEAMARADRDKAFGGFLTLSNLGHTEESMALYSTLNGAQTSDETAAVLRLIGEEIASPDLWVRWVDRISGTGPKPSSDLSQALSKVISAVQAREMALERALEWVTSVASSGSIPDSELATPAVAPNWTQDASNTELQQSVNTVLAAAQKAWPNIGSFPSARQSVVDALFSGTSAICAEACAFATAEAMDLVRHKDVSSSWLTDLVERARAIPVNRLPAKRSLELVGPLAAGAAEFDDYAIPSELLEQSISEIDGSGLIVLDAWLRYNRATQRRVIEVLERVIPVWHKLDEALATHVSEQRSRKSATRLVLRLVTVNPVRAKRLLRLLSAERVVQKTVAENHAELIRLAANSQERKAAGRTVSAFKLTSPDARRTIIDAVSDKIAKSNQSAATDFSKSLPQWIYDAPGGRSLLRQLKDLSKTKHAKRILKSLFGRG